MFPDVQLSRRPLHFIYLCDCSGSMRASSKMQALNQAIRIAEARGVLRAEVQFLIEDHVERPWLGLYGLPRVNVLLVNLALDEAFGVPTLAP